MLATANRSRVSMRVTRSSTRAGNVVCKIFPVVKSDRHAKLCCLCHTAWAYVECLDKFGGARAPLLGLQGASTLNMRLPICYHAKFGCTRPNDVGISKEITKNSTALELWGRDWPLKLISPNMGKHVKFGHCRSNGTSVCIDPPEISALRVLPFKITGSVTSVSRP